MQSSQLAKLKAENSTNDPKSTRKAWSRAYTKQKINSPHPEQEEKIDN